MRFNQAICSLKRHWKSALLILLIIAAIVVVTLWAASRQAHEQNIREAFREQITECTLPGPNPPPNTGHDCYDQGVKRQVAFIADLRVSIDCAVIWVVSQVNSEPIPEACKAVVERINSLISPSTPS